MAIFTKESLETLKQKIDLIDVLSGHIDFKKSGASYKALCPFHDEKTPSFTLQKGDTHYHCFGCGAHGDAIHFLMSHLKLSFSEAVENLAQRFNVHLEKAESFEEIKGPNKIVLKTALDFAADFFQFTLLYTPEGHLALEYLYERGLDLDFIYRFRIGLAPKESNILRTMLHAKSINDEVASEAGLISKGKDHQWRDFFQDRITFPICDFTGAVIGFSARKYKESTFGGKYINTSETALFKKSRVLFGFHHCRRRIAKERKVMIVEGQIDALCLIASGFNIVVAAQGTAFGEGHAKELLSLGVNEVYLALDSDQAGRQAAYKIGDIFQKQGVDTRILLMPEGADPDSFIREQGPDSFLNLMDKAIDYLTFSVNFFSQKVNIDSPAGKNELVNLLSKQIRSWEHPLMVHESLRKLAHLMKIPEELIGVGQNYLPNIYIKKSGNIGLQTIDPDKILESDFLRWLLVAGSLFSDFMEIAKVNLVLNDLRTPHCQRLYLACLDFHKENKKMDLLSLAICLDDPDAHHLISEILLKKVNLERAKEHFIETIQKVLDRNWMETREEIKIKIQSGQSSEEEVFELVKKFDELKKNPPKAQIPFS